MAGLKSRAALFMDEFHATDLIPYWWAASARYRPLTSALGADLEPVWADRYAAVE